MKYRLFLLLFLAIYIVNSQNVEQSSNGSVHRLEKKFTNEQDNLIKISKERLLVKEKQVIYVNNKKNVSLFFPKPIRQGIVGANHYVFSYNEETPNFLGIIKGSYGIESNLLVITTDGQVYSFVVRYARTLNQLNYFVSINETIGNEDQNKKIEKPKDRYSNIKDTQDFTGSYETQYYNSKLPDTAHFLYNRDRYEHYKKFSSNLTIVPHKIKDKKIENDGISLELKDIVYNYNELYFYMEIKNKSGVDYDVNFLNISTTNRNKRKRKSSQTILKKPLFVYKLYSRVKRNSYDRVVYVLPKFSINKQKKVIIELNELNGERNLQLEIPKELINNPR